MKKRKVGELYGHPIVDGYESLTLKHEIHIDDLLKGKDENNQDGSQGGNTSKWTGHADVKGLKAIGWDDDDIAYYQQYGVNWNEEDDEYHKVSEDNKSLYRVLTVNNISSYKDRIVYLPKVDTSNMTDMSLMFNDFAFLVAIPHLKTTNVTTMMGMFWNCRSLVCIPPMYTKNVTSMASMFTECRSLVFVPQLETTNVTNMYRMFMSCNSIVSIPYLDTKNVTDMSYMFSECYSLINIPQLDTSKTNKMTSMFYRCHPLIHVNLKNAAMSYQLNDSALLSKESILYLINNEAATSAITIKLANYAYIRLSTDPDIVAALAAHPKISLAK